LKGETRPWAHNNDNNHTILAPQFKILVAQKFEAEPEQLVLIFAGKIMKDTDTLQMHNIKDNLTVHLVIKAPTRNNEQPARQPADVRQTPFGLNQFGGLAGMEALGAGSNTFMDLQARMPFRCIRSVQLRMLLHVDGTHR